MHIDEYGEDRAKTLVQVAKDIATGEADGKTYEMHVEP